MHSCLLWKIKPRNKDNKSVADPRFSVGVATLWAANPVFAKKTTRNREKNYPKEAPLLDPVLVLYIINDTKMLFALTSFS